MYKLTEDNIISQLHDDVFIIKDVILIIMELFEEMLDNDYDLIKIIELLYNSQGFIG